MRNDAATVDVQHHIDVMWCDVQGVYVRGWAHAGSDDVTTIQLRCGDFVAHVDDRHARPDVGAAFPAADAGRCGFTCYLACPPFRPVYLDVSTAGGTRAFELKGIVAPDIVTQPPKCDLFERFIVEMKRVGGRVVEIGARAVSPGASLQAQRFEPECSFTGIDVHAAPGVDLVADAHFLSQALPVSSVDGVFSLAVLEHLAAPWLVAAEINRVLKIGGLTFHTVPHSWPIHETPNDFWRMSDDGLKIIFGTATGFELVDSTMSDPIQMLPHPSMRRRPFLEFPLGRGMGGAHIIARKVADIDADAVRWPASRASLESQGRAYPRTPGDA